jgi:hypothetical protein
MISGIDGPFISVHPTRILAWGLDTPNSTSPRLNGMPYNARDVDPWDRRHPVPVRRRALPHKR